MRTKHAGKTRVGLWGRSVKSRMLQSVSKECKFDLQFEIVDYLVEFILYDLRQTVQIFIAIAFRLWQLHLGVFQSFHFGYKGGESIWVYIFSNVKVLHYISQN